VHQRTAESQNGALPRSVATKQRPMLTPIRSEGDASKDALVITAKGHVL
jgi:hypothetical protein